jgi:hypothetical protein
MRKKIYTTGAFVGLFFNNLPQWSPYLHTSLIYSITKTKAVLEEKIYESKLSSNI